MADVNRDKPKEAGKSRVEPAVDFARVMQEGTGTGADAAPAADVAAPDALALLLGDKLFRDELKQARLDLPRDAAESFRTVAGLPPGEQEKHIKEYAVRQGQKGLPGLEKEIASVQKFKEKLTAQLAKIYDAQQA